MQTAFRLANWQDKGLWSIIWTEWVAEQGLWMTALRWDTQR